MFFKKKELDIVSPVGGELVNISAVPDDNFSREILGKGIAIIPDEKEIYSPVSGIVTTLFPTLHAIGITTKEGVELFIHIGLNTVNLGGVCFEAMVGRDAGVKRGNLLIKADINKIKREGYDIVTPIIICNPNEFKEIIYSPCKRVKKGDVIMKVRL